MSGRELVDVTLKDFGFTFQVVKLPEDSIEDKLALASSETGLVCKMQYQNFLFTETVLNLERLFHFMVETSGGDPQVQLAIRDLLEDGVYSVNPRLDPEELIINKNGIIKYKTSDEGVPLKENPDWHKVLEEVNPYVVVEEVDIVDDPSGLIDTDKDEAADFRHVDTVKKVWERTNLELEIRKFSRDDLPDIFPPNIMFPDELRYTVYVINRCILTAEHLFTLADSMRLSEDASITVLTEELYKLCIEVNPFLKYGEIDLDALKSNTNSSLRRSNKDKKKVSPESDRRFSQVTKPELLSLPNRMKQRIVGQDEAIDQIVETIQVASCGLRDPEKPIAVYLLAGTTGVGKCHGRGTKIRMFDGSVRNVEDVVTGDFLMGDDSGPREVLSLARGRDDMFLVSPVKGEPFTCNKAHILSLKNTTTKEIVNISIEDYLKTNKHFKHLHKLYRVGVEYPKKEVLVDPYFVGLWLGDGNSKNTGVTTADVEIVDYLNSYATSLGLKLRANELKNNASNTYFITAGNCPGPSKGKNSLLTNARLYGLMNERGDKLIPADYLNNSRAVRLQVLAGLIDSDGYLINNTFEYVTKSGRLSEDVLTLSRSLGFCATHREKIVEGNIYHRIFISGNINEVPVKLVRKKAAPRKQVKDVLVTGFDLEYLGKDDYFGFSISGNRLYLLNDFTVTHNTLCSKVLAEELCGSREAMIRVDCSEYTQQHDIQKLIGAPPSYVGYEDGGYLTNAIQKYPFSVVLFDEIEKAHNKLFDLLLQILDDARLTDGKGNVTNFRDCVILMTSNVGVSEAQAVKNTMGFGDDSLLTEERKSEALKAALKKRFRPEFINRIDSTISFRSLTKDDAIGIIDLLLNKVCGYLANRDITAKFTDSIKEMVFDKGCSKKYGARPLERAIEKEVIRPMAQMILRDEIQDGANVKVDYKKGKVQIRKLKKPASKPSADRKPKVLTS